MRDLLDSVGIRCSHAIAHKVLEELVESVFDSLQLWRTRGKGRNDP